MEGKIKVIPDQATITATVRVHGNNIKEVKRNKTISKLPLFKVDKKNEFSCS
jgi:hypothetical protein